MIKRLVYILYIIPLYITCCGFTNNQIANAIYKAEASRAHPYGILAHYKKTTPRQACLNTIAHARRDYSGPADGFMLFLSRRYAPIGAGNDPRNRNKNWYKNVMYFLNHSQNKQ